MQDEGQAPDAEWGYTAEGAGAPQSPAAHATTQEVSWTASEYIAHHKTAGWYGLLAIGAVVISALIYVLTKDAISAAMIIVLGIIFGVFAARQPRVLQYRLNGGGLTIANKFYPFASFRSFAIIQEDGIESISLMPLKRFMPLMSVYFDPDDGDKIVELLADYLPLEKRQADPVDRLMRRLRF